MSYYCFLILFSYILLCNFYPMYYVSDLDSQSTGRTRISLWEVLLIFWVLNFLVDEILKVINMFWFNQFRRFFSLFKAFKHFFIKIKQYEKNSTFFNCLKSYILLSSWELVTSSAIFLFFIATCLRFANDKKAFKAAQYCDLI